MKTITGKLKQLAFGLVLMAIVLPHFTLAGSRSATYRVTFTATWSNKTHPHAGFPARPFSSAAFTAIERSIGKSVDSHRLGSN
jgi:hypothetical protein